MRPEKALVFRTHLEESGMQIRGKKGNKIEYLMILKALKLKTLGVGVVNIQASKCNAWSPICSATQGAPLDGGRGDAW